MWRTRLQCLGRASLAAAGDNLGFRMAEHQTTLSSALSSEERKLLACVHCGLCLEACPTYVHTGDENDSPRGRIYLMRAVEEERLSIASLSFTNHIDRCLGCRACESACPAGVQYGQLLEAARSDIASQGEPRGWTSRALRFALRHVWLHPSRLGFAFALARVFRDAGLPSFLLKLKPLRLLPRRLELALALLESSSPNSIFRDGDEHPAATAARIHERDGRPFESGRERAAQADAQQQASRVAEGRTEAFLFTGCVMEGLFARVNRATARVLAANGCATRAPEGQACCGALHAHAGDLDAARALARRNIEAFDADEGEVPIITNAGGCGAMLASYAHLLSADAQYAERAAAFSQRVRDVSQQLQTTGIRRGAPAGDQSTTTYDASCHLLHGQRASVEPLEMLGAVVGLKFVPLEGSDVCCGGAGVYNLLQRELSERVLAEKLKHIEETGARVLATGNPGCHMQIGAGARLAGKPLSVCHPVELLDESYRRAGLYVEEKQ